MTISLQDRVYFGTFWQILDRDGSTASLQLGGGFGNATIDRTADGDFFAGIVEKRDVFGRVTDVVLSFAGAQGADAVQGEALSAGIVLDEAIRAAAIYDSLMADPAYANARIHVTGHSLGAGYTEYVLAHSIAAHGTGMTDARADFVAFGAPNWLPNIATATGVGPALLEGRFTDYAAANDPVLGNGRELNGFERIGTTYYLPPFEGADLLGIATAAVASHWPTTYSSALGLPSWMTGTQQDTAVQAVSAQFTTGNAYDPTYGAPGTLDMLVWGSEASDGLIGRDGDDVIVGNGGADVMTGGAGADTFHLLSAEDSGATAATADRITDFDHGDRLDVSMLDANTATLWEEQFAYVGNAGFTGAGQLRSWVSGNSTWIAGNVDADLAADFLIRLDGRHVLQASDFVLGSGDLLGGLPWHARRSSCLPNCSSCSRSGAPSDATVASAGIAWLLAERSRCFARAGTPSTPALRSTFYSPLTTPP